MTTLPFALALDTPHTKLVLSIRHLLLVTVIVALAEGWFDVGT